MILEILTPLPAQLTRGHDFRNSKISHMFKESLASSVIQVGSIGERNLWKYIDTTIERYQVQS